MKKRMLSVLLVLAMLLSVLPVNVFAEDAEELSAGTPETEEVFLTKDEPELLPAVTEEEEIPAAAEEADIAEEADEAGAEECALDAPGNILTPENFPDPVFLAVLRTRFPGGLSRTDAEECDELELSCADSAEKISDLTGIAFFRNLIYLDCSGNRIKNLDVSGLEILQYLYCGSNALETLTLGSKDEMYVINCANNRLTEIDISGIYTIDEFYCGDNRLSGIDAWRTKIVSRFEPGVQYAAEPLPSYEAFNGVVFYTYLGTDYGEYLEFTAPNETAYVYTRSAQYLMSVGFNDSISLTKRIDSRGLSADMQYVIDCENRGKLMSLRPDHIVAEAGPQAIVPDVAVADDALLSALLESGHTLNFYAADADGLECSDVISCEYNEFAGTFSVTPLAEGTGYAVLELALEGTPVIMDKARVDVTAGKVSSAVTGAGLLDTAVDVELYKTANTEIRYLLRLDSLLQYAGLDASELKSAYGCTAVESAYFCDAEGGRLDINGSLGLRPVSDGRLEVVRDPDMVAGVFAGTQTVPAKFKANIAFEFRDGTTMVSDGAVTVNVRKALPKLKIAAVKLNSCIPGDACQTAITGAAAEIASVEGALPDWLEYDDGFVFRGTEKQKASATVKVRLAVEGWSVMPEASVKVSCAPVLPKIKLSKTSVSLRSGGADYADITYTATPSEFSDPVYYPVTQILVTEGSGKALKTVNWADYFSCESFRDDAGVNRIRFTSGTGDGMAHTFKVYFSIGGKTMSLTMKISSAAKNPYKLTVKTTGAMDTSQVLSGVLITPTVANLNMGGDWLDGKYELKITGTNGKTAIPSTQCKDMFIDVPAADAKGKPSIKVSMNNKKALSSFRLTEGFVYTAELTISLGSEKLVTTLELPIKTSDPAKVSPAVTVKAAGKLDVIRSNEIELDVKATNISNGWYTSAVYYDLSEHVGLKFYRTYDSLKKAKVHEEVDVIDSTANDYLGSTEVFKAGYARSDVSSVKVRVGLADNGIAWSGKLGPVNLLKDKFTVCAFITAPDGKVYESKEVPLTMTKGKVKVKLSSASGVMKLKDCYDSVTVPVTADVYKASGYAMVLSGISLDAKSAKLFNYAFSPDGSVQLIWRDHLLPSGKMAPKAGSSMTVKLSLTFYGNNTEKPDTTVSYKIIFR